MNSANVIHEKSDWTNRQISFARTMKELFKKHLKMKVRKYSTFVEFFFAMTIYIVIYPVWLYSKKDIPQVLSPEIQYPQPYQELAKFLLMTGEPTIVILPDRVLTRQAIGTVFNQIRNMFNISKEIIYCNTTNEMRTHIHSSDKNGLGIQWANVDSNNSISSPRFLLFHQSLGPTAESDIIQVLTSSVLALRAQQINPMSSEMLRIGELLNSNISIQEYPILAHKEELDLSGLISQFGLFPIIFSTMSDLQTILEEKDNKVAELGFMMGCSETAYWLVSFLVPMATSILPYAGFTYLLCYWCGFVGSSASFIFAVSFLFIVSQILFQMWLTSLIKVGSSGRILTIVMIVIIMFCQDLHYWFTLRETSNESLKHIFSLIPISAYELFLMSVYQIHYNNFPPVTWTTMKRDVIYSPSLGLFWLACDCGIYFVLFVICNACVSRQHGVPPIGWKNLFNIFSWPIFSTNNETKIHQITQDFIKVVGMRKSYQNGDTKVEALKGVDFDIKNNEIIVMIGPNGAGKTTLMNILSGTIEPSQGDLYLFDEQNPRSFLELRKYIGVCYQENVLISLLSVREHFHLFGAFRGISENALNESIEYYSSSLQLTEMLDNRAGDLSGGQKRKLCLSLALLGNPPMIILDEPTAGVDVQARQLIWKMISSLKNTTSLISSHALEEAEAVSSRLLIVSAGRIYFCGTSTQLRSEYKCGYLLRIEREDKKYEPIIEYLRSFNIDVNASSDRSDTFILPVHSSIPIILNDMSSKMEYLQIKSYSLSVEHLEDMLIKLIQNDEAQIR